MHEGYNEFKNLNEKNYIRMNYKCYDHFLHEIVFLEIKDEISFDLTLQQKIIQSKVIVIDTYSKDNYQYFIICFDNNNNLIFFDKSLENILNTVLSKIDVTKIFIIPKPRDNFQHYFDSINLQKDTTQAQEFAEEIINFKNVFKIERQYNDAVNMFWKIINPCLSGYIIRKSYIHSYNNRFDIFMEDIEKSKELNIYDENEFISLITVGMTVTSSIDLYYHNENGKLFVIKKIFKDNEKLGNREINNYANIYHPLMPKYYGIMIGNGLNYIVIEFINGKTLNEIKSFNLNLKQKIVIIIEILYIMQYLHNKNYIYRDLKPNNVIIDSNYHAVLKNQKIWLHF